MVKKVNKVQNNAQNNVQNQQVNNNDCQHVQLGGMAYYDAKQYFLFSPQESGVNKVPRFASMCSWVEWLTMMLSSISSSVLRNRG